MPADVVLDLTRWDHAPDAVDEAVIRRCVGPTLDVGCGPGRMVLALGRRGVPALGVDVTREVVRVVHRAGGLALARSVFDPLPGEGRWPHALLLDGCVGIGASPERLLARVGELLGPGGLACVEHDPDPDRSERVTARIRLPGGQYPPALAWALVGLRRLTRAAATAGLEVVESWTAGGRALSLCRRAHR